MWYFVLILCSELPLCCYRSKVIWNKYFWFSKLWTKLLVVFNYLDLACGSGNALLAPNLYDNSFSRFLGSGNRMKCKESQWNCKNDPILSSPSFPDLVADASEMRMFPEILIWELKRLNWTVRDELRFSSTDSHI